MGVYNSQPPFDTISFFNKTQQPVHKAPKLSPQTNPLLITGLYTQKTSDLAQLLEERLVFFNIIFDLLTGVDDGGVVSSTQFLAY